MPIALTGPAAAARHGLDELAAMGTDRVVLTPTWYMDGATSSTVVRDAPEPERPVWLVLGVGEQGPHQR